MASNLTHEQQIKLIGDLEIEMMADMYNRMVSSCQKKCVPPKFKESELSKGEAVCLDRCVAKYMDIHDRIGKKLTQATQQDEEAMKKNASASPEIIANEVKQGTLVTM